MQNYEAREQWLRTKLVEKNAPHTSYGKETNLIISDINPDNFKPLGNNWQMEIYELEPNLFSIDVFERSSTQTFVFYVHIKE